MPAGFRQFRRLAAFDDVAGSEHEDAIGDKPQHVEIAAGAEHGDAVIRPDAIEQDEELGLFDRIERGGRLIEDDEAGAAHQCAGQCQPLQLGRGKLARQVVEHIGRKADDPHGFDQAVGLFVDQELLFDAQRLGERQADGKIRIEGGARIGEQQADAGARLAGKIVTAIGRTIEGQLAGAGAAEAGDKAEQLRLAGAGGTENPHSFAPTHRQGDVLEHRDRRLAVPEP